MSKDFITTSDGKIAVRKSQFHQMAFSDPGRFQTGYEIAIYTDLTPGGRIYRYGNDVAARDKAMKEIQEQL